MLLNFAFVIIVSGVVQCIKEMKFTLSWLKDHIDTKLHYTEIYQKFIDLGIEIEYIVDQRDKYKNFVTGIIVDAVRHPNADKLCLCEVDVGGKILHIVCGASNARKGIYVIVALEGAVVPCSGITIKCGKIRGEESQGMLCSDTELSIALKDYAGVFSGDNTCDGIIELNKCQPGLSVCDLLQLNDVIFDASITPNRADCFSVRGLARDLVGAGCGSMINLNSSDYYKTNKGASIDNNIDVRIATNKCDYYTSCVFRNIIRQTPTFIAKRLKLVGQNLINPAVDIANYVCLDIGQPLHLFDKSKIASNIVVREAYESEKISALDNNTYTMHSGSVVVGDLDKPYAIAGIIGGKETAISEDTSEILIESAYFNSEAITVTGQKLRICTDARVRFERGVDPQAVEEGIHRFLQLANVREFSDIKRFGLCPVNAHKVELSFDLFASISGFGLDVFLNAKEVLERLGCNVIEADSTKIIVETPSFRHDLVIPEDIAEEIIRVYGINAIEPVRLEMGHKQVCNNVQKYTDTKLLNYLCNSGYQEIKTFSFVEEECARLFTRQGSSVLKIQNPINAAMNTMRNSLIASAIPAIAKNQCRGMNNLKLFEYGHIFDFDSKGDINERQSIAAIMTCDYHDRHWNSKQRKVEIFDIKQDVEKCMSILSTSYTISNGSNGVEYYHPGRCGTIFAKINGTKTIIGYFGELHPSIVERYEIVGPVMCFEIFLDNLQILQKKVNLNVSQYQAVSRDFSFIFNGQVTADKILNSIKKMNITEVVDVRIFDLYKHESIGSNKKSVGVEVVLQSQKETLQDEFIECISNKIIATINQNLGGELRLPGDDRPK